MTARAIVNYGVYKFSEAERSAAIVRVTTQVEKEPSNKYSNLKLQKERSFYGFAQVMIDDWIHSVIELQFGLQVILEFSNDIGQHQVFHYCTQKNIAVNLTTVSASLGGAGLSIDENPLLITPMPFDRILFKLYNDTTLLVNVSTDPFINPCSAELQFPIEEPPIDEPSNRDVEPNSEDSPYDIPDPPYDEPTADDGETYNPQRPEPTEGEAGQVYAWYYEVRVPLATEGPPGRFIRGTAYVTAPYGAPVKFLNRGSGSGFESGWEVNTPAGKVVGPLQSSGVNWDVQDVILNVSVFTLVS